MTNEAKFEVRVTMDKGTSELVINDRETFRLLPTLSNGLLGGKCDWEHQEFVLAEPKTEIKEYTEAMNMPRKKNSAAIKKKQCAIAKKNQPAKKAKAAKKNQATKKSQASKKILPDLPLIHLDGTESWKIDWQKSTGNKLFYEPTVHKALPEMYEKLLALRNTTPALVEKRKEGFKGDQVQVFYKFELPGYALNPADPTQRYKIEAVEVHSYHLKQYVKVIWEDLTVTDPAEIAANEEKIAMEKCNVKTDKAYRMERMLAKMSTFIQKDHAELRAKYEELLIKYQQRQQIVETKPNGRNLQVDAAHGLHHQADDIEDPDFDQEIFGVDQERYLVKTDDLMAMPPFVDDDHQEEFGVGDWHLLREHYIHDDMDGTDVEMREEKVVMEDALLGLEESVQGMRVDDFEMDANEEMEVEDEGALMVPETKKVEQKPFIWPGVLMGTVKNETAENGVAKNENGMMEQKPFMGFGVHMQSAENEVAKTVPREQEQVRMFEQKPSTFHH